MKQNNLFPWEYNWLKKTIPNLEEYNINCYSSNQKEIPQLMYSCAILTKENPKQLFFNRELIFKRFLNRKKYQNSLSFSRNYQEFFCMIFAHEIGHYVHEELEKEIGEENIISFLLTIPTPSKYNKDGWRDIFAELFALHTIRPDIFDNKDIQLFWEFVNTKTIEQQ